MTALRFLTNEIKNKSNYRIYGQVSAITGLTIEVSGLNGLASIGSICKIETNLAKEKYITCEVVGFNKSYAILQPYGTLEGIPEGTRVSLVSHHKYIYPHHSWQGRILDAFARPIDKKGTLFTGDQPYQIKSQPIPAHERRRLGDKIKLGVKVLDLFTPCCQGQRLGIFAGSGVGKSLLLSMIARNTKADVIVIAMIGERGRELQEFIDDYLQEEGLKKSVLVVATADEAPLVRRQAAWTAMAVAESFRDQGESVLFLLDSITRFSMAQREIGLAAFEPPTSKGYTPSVFSLLPQLLERAGPGRKADTSGDITALVTVLVEGDDFNEPISDAVRSILDGHIILDRNIADQNRFPAVNILKSLSRSMPNCNTDKENNIINSAKSLFALYSKMEELIQLGAYKLGSDLEIDKAIRLVPKMNEFLLQQPLDQIKHEDLYDSLESILNEDEDNDTNLKE